MALDARKLGVASDVLAKALCRMLARLVTDHGGGYQIVSVAFPLEDGSNQSLHVTAVGHTQCLREIIF